MRTYGANGNELFIFERSLGELTDIFNESVPQVNAKYLDQCFPQKADWIQSKKQKEEWYGKNINNLDDVKILLTDGWADGAEKALLLKNELEGEIPRAKSKRRKPVWSEDGADLDVDRALAGQWDGAYRSMVTELAPGGSVCVTLNAGWGGNCNLSSDQLFWSGACMLVLSDIFENSGFSVKINAISKNQLPLGELSLDIVTVKDHGEPLRVDALASIVAHAGVFRTFGFRGLLQAPRNVGNGLGRMVPWEVMNSALKKYNQEFDSSNIQVNDCFSKEDAIKEIKRILATIK